MHGRALLVNARSTDTNLAKCSDAS